MKKVFLVFGIILISGLLSFSISKSEWVNKGKYFEMDSTYGEIVDYQVSNENKIYLLNNQNELLVIDFITGKLETRNKLNINNNYICKKISSDAKTTIFAKFNAEFLKSFNYNKIIIDCYIIDNNTLQVVYDDTISVSRVVTGRIFEIKEIVNLDYNLNEKNLLINCKFDALDVGIGYENFFQIFGIFDVINLSNKSLIINYSNIIDDNNFDINNLQNFYILSHKYNSYVDYRYGGSNSHSNYNYLDYYNKDSDTFANIFKNYQFSSSGNIGNENKGMYYDTKCFFHNPITNNFSILTQDENNFKILSFEPIAKKYFDTLSFIENKFIKTVFDKKGLLHSYVDSIYKITSITNKLNTLDSLVFPFIISNAKLTKNEKTSFVILNSKSTNKLCYFTTENLKSIPNTGFEANLTTTLKNKTIKFYSSASPTNLEFEWEVEQGVMIKTKTNYLEYSYKNIGIYDVKLKIIDKQGKEYYFEKLKYIKIKEELKADFSYKFDKEYKENCYFQSISKGDINKYDWDFGDGLKSTEKDPVHNFRNDGNFLVQLIISNGIDNDTIEKYVEIFVNRYSKEKKDFLKSYTLDNKIKPEQYFITNDILKIFSNDNNYKYYPKDRWREEYYDIFYKYNINNFDFINIKSEIEHYYYNYSVNKYFDKYFNSRLLDVENYNFITFNKYYYEYQPSIYLHKEYINYWSFWYNENVIKLPYVITKLPPKLLESKIINLEKIKIVEEINGSLKITNVNEKEILKSETFILDTNLHQIKISQMNDSLLVVYSDSTHNYSGKLILDNQNTELFSNLQLDSTFVFSHTKLINDNIALFGKFTKINSTIAKVYIYNLSSKTLKEFNLPIFKNIEDIVIFNQNLLIAGETINMSGYVLFDKDFSNYKFVYNKEYLGQVKKLHLKNNVVNLVCEKQNNTKYDIYILQDTLENVTSIENEEALNSNFIIFPNPSSDKISLDLGGLEFADLVVYDILGNEIMSIPNYTNRGEIDISTLSIGTYTIQIQTNTGSISQRLLVNR